MNPFDDPSLIFPGEAPADPPPEPPAAPKELIGAVIKLRGLIKVRLPLLPPHADRVMVQAPELNGQTATVRRVLKNGRVEVLLNGPAKQRLSVKMSCLDAAVAAAAAEGEAGCKLVLCPCCGQQMEASSEEECTAHMVPRLTAALCLLIHCLYPGGLSRLPEPLSRGQTSFQHRRAGRCNLGGARR